LSPNGGAFARLVTIQAMRERHLVSRYIYKERRSAALAEWQAVMG
jgi:hypothetical protein